MVDALGDPIVHLVRNSLDHGLEPPDERNAAGKDETGTLEISARHAGGNVVISVRDDGRGIDPAQVAAKAAERGPDPAEDGRRRSTRRSAIELLFAARLLDGRRVPATSPAAASAWTRSAPWSARSAARSR